MEFIYHNLITCTVCMLCYNISFLLAVGSHGTFSHESLRPGKYCMRIKCNFPTSPVCDRTFNITDIEIVKPAVAIDSLQGAFQNMHWWHRYHVVVLRSHYAMFVHMVWSCQHAVYMTFTWICRYLRAYVPCQLLICMTCTLHGATLYSIYTCLPQCWWTCAVLLHVLSYTALNAVLVL